MIRLVVAFGDRERRFNVTLNEKRTLGSAADNDFVVAWPGISKHHAIIERFGEQISIKDVGSKNGIVLSGERRDYVRLQPGDTAQIGRASLRVEQISTSDADIAMTFEEPESSHTTAGAREDTEGMEGSEAIAKRSMAAALRWARAVAAIPILTLDRRRAFLEEAALIVASSALLICSNDGELAVGEVVGKLPGEGELEALAFREAGHDGRWFFVTLGSGLVLAARAATEGRFGAWQREFLEHVGATLFGEPEREMPEIAEGEIVFPATMVVGTSPAMREVRDRLRIAVQGERNVLLRGESGTGKELIARAIHDSSRGRGPFRAINCAAIPSELFEAEMFGIRTGVATGVEKRSGHFIEAEGGTVFLDEIGDLTNSVQAKLLRVLQEREVLALGASTPVKINVRVVCSTNRDLEAMIRRGAYRGDLYYRLCGIEIFLPPLRDRREDIPALAAALASRAARSASRRIRGISRKALSQLSAYDWPGNVRELENVIEQAVTRCPRGGAIETSHLRIPLAALAHGSGTLQSRRDFSERDAIGEALRRANGNKTEAAAILGISRQALYKKLRERKTGE